MSLQGDVEPISAKAIYGGFVTSVTELIDWTGSEPLLTDSFNFKVTTIFKDPNNPALYTDGWDQAYVLASLPASVSPASTLMDDRTGLVPYLLGRDEAGSPVGRGIPRTVVFGGPGAAQVPWSWDMPKNPFTNTPIEEDFGGAVTHG